jgi:hypothetical protein
VYLFGREVVMAAPEPHSHDLKLVRGYKRFKDGTEVEFEFTLGKLLGKVLKIDSTF